MMGEVVEDEHVATAAAQFEPTAHVLEGCEPLRHLAGRETRGVADGDRRQGLPRPCRAGRAAPRRNRC